MTKLETTEPAAARDADTHWLMGLAALMTRAFCDEDLTSPGSRMVEYAGSHACADAPSDLSIVPHLNEQYTVVLSVQGNVALVHAMDPAEVFPYKHPQMCKVFVAFPAMLCKARVSAVPRADGVIA